MRQRSLNQALAASVDDPIKGVSTNTLANVALRVPVLGVPPDSLVEMESEGSSWYNGLEVSLTKQLHNGLQFLSSYTFSKTLDTDGADINSTSSGNALTLGDQNSPSQRWGCSESRLVNGGSIESKLNSYFNASCFASPPIIGADGIGTAFGNSATGIVDGPSQANLDLALTKNLASTWPHEKGTLQIRAEFYNALNHPQFANPDTNFTSPTFGVISNTAVSARVGQLALKFVF